MLSIHLLFKKSLEKKKKKHYYGEENSLNIALISIVPAWK